MRFSAGVAVAGGVAAGDPIALLWTTQALRAVAKRAAIFNNSTTAFRVGLAPIRTGSVTGGTAMTDIQQHDHSALNTGSLYQISTGAITGDVFETTNPSYMRRCPLPGIVGAGIEWAFDAGSEIFITGTSNPAFRGLAFYALDTSGACEVYFEWDELR